MNSVCLESHVTNEINLDLRVSNISGYSAAEGRINQIEISSTTNVVPLLYPHTQTRSIRDASTVETSLKNSRTLHIYN